MLEVRQVQSSCFSFGLFCLILMLFLTYVGKVAAIAAAAVTVAAALIVGAVIGFCAWNNRTIQKKRKGRRLNKYFSPVP